MASMEVSKQIDKGVSWLRLKGRFTFDAHAGFRAGYEELLQADAPRCIEVDLSGIDYLDSAALGMLLLFKERATAVGKEVRLTRPQGIVQQILTVANFDKIFQMS